MVVVGQLVGALLSPEMILAALAGGAFGAALGALPAFIFTGFMVIAGQVADYVNPDLGQITAAVAFGPPFSPAISFAGGVAAAAYAADRGYMQSGFDYHNAKHIAYALGTKPDVLAVGAIFGLLGYWLQTFFGTLLFPFDGIAMGVTISAGVARLAFGYDLIGDTFGNGLLDMNPFANEERRTMDEPVGEAGGAKTGRPETDGGQSQRRFVVEPWLPHQYEWANVATIGVVVGVLGAFITVETGLVFLTFGISAATLVFLNCGVEQIPVTHHIALMGSAAAAAVMADGSGLLAGGATLAIVVGGVFGVIAALTGEVFQRIFYSHGDTHWDPPAAAIAAVSFLIAVLAILGIFPSASYVPTFGL